MNALEYAPGSVSFEALQNSFQGNDIDSWWRIVFTLALGLVILHILLLHWDDAADVPAPTAVPWRSKRDKRQLRKLVLPVASVVKATAAEEPPSPRKDGRRIVPELLMARVNQAMLAMTSGSHRTWDALEVDQSALRSEADDCRPLLVFVNTRSGGQQGMKVLSEMRAYLHQVQVVDLQKEGPEAALSWWSKTGLKYRILVCGGDGTVGWVLGVLEQLKLEYVPPVAILPLGTGNDLARVTGWGGGFTGGSVLPCLQYVDKAHVELLDRWTVNFRDSHAASSSLRRPSFLPALQQPRERSTMTMCNYFGIGVDAAVALEFHQMRERRPDLFVSRIVNKLWYFRSGTVTMFRNTCANIGSKITLECDGVAVEIPPNLEGIIVLNIPSFGGGSELWGQAELCEDGEDSDSSIHSADSPIPIHLQSLSSSMQDGKLEVVGVHGVLQLGASQVGLYKAQRLAQAAHVKITNKVALPVEVDGEPSRFAQDGEIEITLKSQAFMLARSRESSHAVATDVVDWALQRDIISVEQRNKLLKEIANRAQMSRKFSSSKVALE